MPEPRVITFGKAFMGDFSERDYKVMLLSAYLRRRAKHIVLPEVEYWWSERKVAAGVAWALERGLVDIDEERWTIDTGNLHWTRKLGFAPTERGWGRLHQWWCELNGFMRQQFPDTVERVK